ncbi:MAG TPA: EamA family transporter [Ktedonobacterales bacterium]|nr:EamA family transporter [Ktedonobacterales bacterium]
MRGYVVLFALALIWGASFLFIKVGVEQMPPATLVVLRLGFSVLTLSAIIAARPALAAGWRRYWRLGVVVGVVNNVIPFMLITWGEVRIASGVAAILNATTPLFTVLLANWWPDSARESLTPRRGAGVALGFLGVAVLVGPTILNVTGTSGRIIGELAVLVAAASYGVGALLSRRFGGSAMLVGPITMQGSALILSIPVAVASGLPTHMPSAKALGAVITLGVLGTAVAYLLYFWLIRNVGATRTILVTYLLPCTALIWGAIFLGETISWNALAGLALVLVGTMITNGTIGKRLFARRGQGRVAGAVSLAVEPTHGEA